MRLPPSAASSGPRLREVEIHHVDLDLAYAPARWTDRVHQPRLANVTSAFRELEPPPAFDLHAVDTDARWQLGAEPSPVVVSGAQAALLAWLIGRSSGDGLSADGPDGHRTPLPVRSAVALTRARIETPRPHRAWDGAGYHHRDSAATGVPVLDPPSGLTATICGSVTCTSPGSPVDGAVGYLVHRRDCRR